MIGIKSLRLSQVRSHTQADFQFVNDMNAIVGPNGSGKTTVLESIYTLLRGTSFKGSLKEMLQYGTVQYGASLTLQSEKTDHARSLQYQQSGNTIMKKWSIDEKKYARLPLSARLPVILFEPDVARLITGSPQRRRDYIDNLASQLDIEIARCQLRFDRTLQQRNQLLKQLQKSRSNHHEQLFIWDTQLAHLSEQIVMARYTVISKLQKEISQYYEQLGGTDTVFLTYQTAISGDPSQYASRLLQFLETSLPRDIALGHTSFGPHRDDLEIRLADQPAIERASRGETRTVVVALKLLETKILSDHFAKDSIKPILLLDDVLSELDLVHQERVLAGLKDHQVFITTTDAHALTAGVHTIALE